MIIWFRSFASKYLSLQIAKKNLQTEYNFLKQS